MEWSRTLDGYCERLDPGYWAEPLNALSNAAFLLAAVVMWRRLGPDMVLPRALCLVLAGIGAGSYLFHTHATAWAMLADVVPIGMFILIYLFAANRHFWHLGPVPAVLGMLAFLPFAAVSGAVFARLPFFHISAGYWPVALLIAGYALALRRRARDVARGLGIGAGLLGLSLVFRSLDEALCPVWPVGTHFVWHILNGVLLGWMIEVLRQHLTARDGCSTRGGALNAGPSGE